MYSASSSTGRIVAIDNWRCDQLSSELSPLSLTNTGVALHISMPPDRLMNQTLEASL
jgi:hypothetical protein